MNPLPNDINNDRNNGTNNDSRNKLKKLLLAPLIYTAAILLLLEEWLWNTTKRLLALLPEVAFIVRLEQWIGSLSPYAALAIFVLPTLLLLPVKILALVSIAHGHPTLGLLIVLAAKVLGTALVARLYGLTKNTLLSLAWFVRWHDAVLAFKDRMIAQLRATRAWQQITALLTILKQHRQELWAALKARSANGRLGRLIRKFAARQRDRWRQ